MTVMELMAQIEKTAVERLSDLLNKVRLSDAKQGRVEKPDGAVPMPLLQICPYKRGWTQGRVTDTHMTLKR